MEYGNGFYDQLRIDKSVAEKLDFNPYYRPVSTGVGGRIGIEKSEYIDFASNNYLGFANNQEIKKAMIEAVECYGASMCGTPIATGYSGVMRQAEKKAAMFSGLNDSIIFPSCYQANTALFSSIAGKEDIVFIDHFAHASLIHGVQSSGAKVRPFRHNDLEHLRKIFEKSNGYRRKFVVTESVFSTSGVIAEFDGIVELCGIFNAVPVIDDSHGIGTIGATGKGILEEKNIENYEGIYTASLGKALGIAGGMVAGPGKLIDFLRYSCAGFIYSTGLVPSLTAGVIKAFEIVEKNGTELLSCIRNNKKSLTDSLRGYGYPLTDGTAPITSIVSGSMEDTFRLTEKLYRRKMLTTPFVPPSVPLNQGRIRLIAGVDITRNELEEALEIFKQIAEEMK